MSNSQRSRIEAYLGPLYGYAFTLTSNRDQSQDLVQDCALKALSARNVPRDEVVYKTWLFRILRNTHIDRLRRHENRHRPLPDDIGIDSWEIWRCNESVVNGLTVKLGLSKLPPHHREIIALVDIVGFSYGEAAAFLGVPIGTIMSRLSRARKVLMRSLVDGNVRALPLEKKRNSK